MTPAPREDGWEELRRLAEKATPGTWRQSGGRYGLPAFHRARPGFMAFGIGGPGALVYDALALVESSTDAAYIAAVSPDVVLRLLAAARGEPGLDVERLAQALGGGPLVSETYRQMAERVAAEYDRLGSDV